MMHGMSDAESVKGVSFDRALFRRVWRFARAYRPQLAGFLVTIVIEAIDDVRARWTKLGARGNSA